MSILKNEFPPFAALINAKKLEQKIVKETVRVAELREYGLYNNRFVADEWDFQNTENEKPKQIIAALNNCDTERMLLTILKNNTSAVIEGLAIASYATGIEGIEIVIPIEDTELVEKISVIAKECGITITVKVGIVNIIATGNCIIHHIETLAAITSLFQDKANYKKTIVVAVKKLDKNIGQPMEISYGKTIGGVIGVEEKEQTKALSVGTKLYNTSAFEQVIDENFSMENGVITVFDTKCCMADQAEKAILEVRKVGCGKCTFCREGVIQIHTIMKDITNGKGKPTDVSMLKEIGEAMRYSSLCSIGQTGANHILGSLQYFGEEIESHIRKKRCPSEVCSAFMNIYIDPTTCDGCGDCIDVCDVNCIEGKSGYIHMIDEFDCIKCGKCVDACLKNAVIRTVGRVPKLPERITRVGRFKRR